MKGSNKVILITDSLYFAGLNDGEYNMEEAGVISSQEIVMSNTISEWRKYANNKKTLAFACNIAHAEKLKNEFRAERISADCIHSKMSSEQIKKMFK